MIALQILPSSRECIVGPIPMDRSLVSVVLLIGWGTGTGSIDQHLHRAELSSI